MLDLRGLGTQRTLVLVDGHRQVGSAIGTNSVDTNTIPTSLIDRVEISSGDAATIYGADALGGAVNFVLKHNLEGLHANFQGNLPQGGGAGNGLLSASYGINFDGGRGNVTLTGEYFTQKRLSHTKRDFSDKDYEGLNTTDGTNYSLVSGYSKYYSANGGIITDPSASTTPSYLATGETFDQGISYADELLGDLVPKTDRYIGEVSGNYEIRKYLKVSLDAKYAQVYTDSYGNVPRYQGVVYSDNGNLSSTVQSKINSNKLSTDLINAGVAPSDCYACFFGTQYDALTSLRNEERTGRNTLHAVLDLSGDTGDFLGLADTHYDVSSVYGQTNVTDKHPHNINWSRLAQAIDTVDSTACRDTSNDCVAYNPFNQTKAQSAAVAWFTHNTVDKGHMRQYVESALFSGDIPVTEAFLAEPAQFAVGGEYRINSSEADGDETTQYRGYYYTSPTYEEDTLNTGEAFAETSLEILKDRTFAQELRVDAAIRESWFDYEGAVTSSTNWKVGGIWSPVDWLQLRTNYSHAARFANIGELEGYRSDVETTTHTVTNTYYKRYATTSFKTITNTYTANLYQSYEGNPDLKPETAKTLTFGFSVNVPWIENLEFSADWYKVDISKQIVMSETPVDEDYLGGTTTRYPTSSTSYYYNKTSGYYYYYQTTSQYPFTEIFKYENSGTSKTGGVDFAAAYHIDSAESFGVQAGTFDFHLNGNYLTKLTNSVDTEVAIGTAYNPMWHLTLDMLWTYGNLDVDYNIDWFSRTKPVNSLFNLTSSDVIQYGNFDKFAAKFENSIQVGYLLGDAYRFYAGIKNLTDQHSSKIYPIYPVDPQGRTFYLGITANADQLGKLVDAF